MVVGEKGVTKDVLIENTTITIRLRDMVIVTMKRPVGARVTWGEEAVIRRIVSWRSSSNLDLFPYSHSYFPSPLPSILFHPLHHYAKIIQQRQA